MSITNEPCYRLEEFEGPLDMLLFLIKKNEVNIYDIPIAQITEQYIRYLSFATKVNLESLTDFTLMASTLMYIKSQMLLPVEFSLDAEIEDPRTELVQKLIEYQRFKKLSEMIGDRDTEIDWAIAEEGNQIALPFNEEELIWQEVEVWDLLKMFSSLISAAEVENIIDLYEEVTINEKITLIRELLEKSNEFSFKKLVLNSRSIMEIVCAFLAMLELVKQREISVLQNKLFGEIRINKVG